MRTHPVDPREEKLPVWVQQRLKSLRADLEYAGQRLAEKSEDDAVIWANPYSDYPQGVGGVGDSVRFHVPNGDITVILENDGRIRAMCTGKRGSDTMVVRPQAANVVTIGIEDFR